MLDIRLQVNLSHFAKISMNAMLVFSRYRKARTEDAVGRARKPWHKKSGFGDMWSQLSQIRLWWFYVTKMLTEQPRFDIRAMCWGLFRGGIASAPSLSQCEFATNANNKMPRVVLCREREGNDGPLSELTSLTQKRESKKRGGE